MKAKGLEGKLGDVLLGDIVILQAPGCTIAGYPVRKDLYLMPFSFLSPNSQWREDDVKSYQFHDGGILADGIRSLASTIRRYNLGKFTQYERLSNGQPQVGRQDWYERIAVGDLVLMKNAEIIICGFLAQRGGTAVRLSHVSPNSELSYSEIYQKDLSREGGNQGDRYFIHSRFSHFAILRKSSDFKPLQEPKEEAMPQKTYLSHALTHAFANVGQRLSTRRAGHSRRRRRHLTRRRNAICRDDVGETASRRPHHRLQPGDQKRA